MVAAGLAHGIFNRIFLPDKPRTRQGHVDGDHGQRANDAH